LLILALPPSKVAEFESCHGRWGQSTVQITLQPNWRKKVNDGPLHAIHSEAPLRLEREAYLLHLRELGASYRELKLAAGYLLHIVQIMEMNSLRPVSMEEIAQAGRAWADYKGPHRRYTRWRGTPRYFIRYAKQWFQFLGTLPRPSKPRYHEILSRFANEMIAGRGLSPSTVKSYEERIAVLLCWLERRGTLLSGIRLQHIDAFVDERRATCCNATLASYCQAMRTFFSWAERRQLCRPGLPWGIKSPSAPKFVPGNIAPTWAQVRQLIADSDGSDPFALRAKAVLLLFSIYGLRSSEVSQLTLGDFDWVNECFIVRRSKKGGLQQFPIQFEVGEAIIRYLRDGRPRTQSRLVFVTHRRPFLPLKSGAMWEIVGERMRALGVNTKHCGPHALRHACATELMRKGVSVKDIADYLGHRDTRCVGIYARYDSRLLREVANFRLRGGR
jgi:site-specific recombinase XerD